MLGFVTLRTAFKLGVPVMYSASFWVQFSEPGAPLGHSVTTLVCAGNAAATSGKQAAAATNARMRAAFFSVSMILILAPGDGPGAARVRGEHPR